MRKRGLQHHSSVLTGTTKPPCSLSAHCSDFRFGAAVQGGSGRHNENSGRRLVGGILRSGAQRGTTIRMSAGSDFLTLASGQNVTREILSGRLPIPSDWVGRFGRQNVRIRQKGRKALIRSETRSKTNGARQGRSGVTAIRKAVSSLCGSPRPSPSEVPPLPTNPFHQAPSRRP